MRVNLQKRRTPALLALLFLLSACATSHHGFGASPSEPGQAAFGAIAEVVTILNANANTDWSKVDIDKLREHLVDMNTLTLNADVRSETRANEVIYYVSGTGKTIRAIHAMVPAHASQLAKSLNWDTKTQKTPDGAILSIRSDDPKELVRLQALGFFGVMATGSHHQIHHLQMATGVGHAHGH